MIPVEPEYSVADQKCAYLITPIVKYVRFPVWMEAFARVSMFVQMRAVEFVEGVYIAGEMRWHPVQYHTEARLVQLFNQVHKMLRCTIAGRRGIEPCYLVAPAGVVRVLHDRHKLYMGKAHFLNIRHQFFGKLVVGQKLVGAFPATRPGTNVHLVNRLWLV